MIDTHSSYGYPLTPLQRQFSCQISLFSFVGRTLPVEAFSAITNNSQRQESIHSQCRFYNCDLLRTHLVVSSTDTKYILPIRCQKQEKQENGKKKSKLPLQKKWQKNSNSRSKKSQV